MTDHFESWVNGMDEDMYEDWLDNTATEAQEEKALNLRSPLSEKEEEDIEAQQEYIPDSGRKEVNTNDDGQVYDNRDIPPRRINAEVILDPITRRIREIRQKPETVTINPHLEPIGVDTPDRSLVARDRHALRSPIGPGVTASPQTRTSFRQRLSNISTRLKSLFRGKS